MGGLFSERSGVINIASEGLMMVGAFAAAAVAQKTGSPLLGDSQERSQASHSRRSIMAWGSLAFAPSDRGGTAINMLAAETYAFCL